MPRLAYVNHQYIPHNHASLSIDDRGTQFGDAVYEVISILNGKTVDMQSHIARLHRSLGVLNIPMPMSDKALEIICAKLVKTNRLKNGLVYMQLSRGTMNRKHMYPTDVPLYPNVIITTHHMNLTCHSSQLKTVKIKSFNDNRWERVDVKTTMLLPNCMAKTEALDAGFGEILYVKDGIVTECGSSNFSYFDTNGVFHTAPPGDILVGCTRNGLIVCAKQLGITVEENHFSLQEAKNAKFAFISSASQFLTPVSHIDNTKIATEIPKICQTLFDLYLKRYSNI